MDKNAFGLLATSCLVSFACADAAPTEGGLAPHALSATPGCWSPPSAGPAGPAGPAGASEAFQQMLAATEGMRDFTATDLTARLDRVLEAVRAQPGAKLWRGAIGEIRVGLNAFGGTNPPSWYGASGTLGDPGRPGSTSAPRGYEVWVTSRTPDRVDYVLVLHLEVCEATPEGTATCALQDSVGRAWTTPELSGLELGAQQLRWNDDFVSLRSTASALPFERGCDPRTGDSYERRLDVELGAELVFGSHLACWDAAGEAISCAGIDPGL